MNHTKRMIRSSLGLLLALLLMPQAAEAYLDPGTGSFVIQVVLASLLGALFTLKSYWRVVKHNVGRLFGRHQEPASTEQK